MIRIRELESLEEMYRRDGFDFTLVYGKTELIKGSAKAKRGISLTSPFVRPAVEKESRIHVLRQSLFSLTRIGLCQVGDPRTVTNEEIGIV